MTCGGPHFGPAAARGWRKLVRIWVVAASITFAFAPKFSFAQTSTAPVLRGDCSSGFENKSIIRGGYQYISSLPWGRAVFAVADDGVRQSCGMSTEMNYYEPAIQQIDESALFSMPKFDYLKAVAIYRCELARPDTLRANCRVYAIKKRIVWLDPVESEPPMAVRPYMRPIVNPRPLEPAPGPPPVPAATPVPAASPEPTLGAIDAAKEKCAKLGFKAGTPLFGDCVLKLSR